MIKNDLTEKVLKAYSHIDDTRINTLVASFIKHLHGFITEVALTSEEWEYCWNMLYQMAMFTKPDRNEFLLMADILGVSQLVENINHPQDEKYSDSALVGPYFRANAPKRADGESIVSKETVGERLNIKGQVVNDKGEGIANVTVDIWQAASNGLYECEDPMQVDMNLRGKYQTDEHGYFNIEALVPTAYPVPHDGPAGQLLNVAKRNIYRPEHIHFIFYVEGYETLVTQVFHTGDSKIEDDPVFTATEAMAEVFTKKENASLLSCRFVLKKGVAHYPDAPIK